jgi:hypothetical protein
MALDLDEQQCQQDIDNVLSDYDYEVRLVRGSGSADSEIQQRYNELQQINYWGRVTGNLALPRLLHTTPDVSKDRLIHFCSIVDLSMLKSIRPT